MPKSVRATLILPTAVSKSYEGNGHAAKPLPLPKSKNTSGLIDRLRQLVRHKPTAYGRATLGAKPFRRAPK